MLGGDAVAIWAAAVTADGKRAVSGSRDKTLRVWDIDHGACLVVFTCDAPVLCRAWTGALIMAGDHSNQVHLFA